MQSTQTFGVSNPAAKVLFCTSVAVQLFRLWPLISQSKRLKGLTLTQTLMASVCIKLMRPLLPLDAIDQSQVLIIVDPCFSNRCSHSGFISQCFSMGYPRLIQTTGPSGGRRWRRWPTCLSLAAKSNIGTTSSPEPRSCRATSSHGSSWPEFGFRILINFAQTCSV